MFQPLLAALARQSTLLARIFEEFIPTMCFQQVRPTLNDLLTSTKVKDNRDEERTTRLGTCLDRSAPPISAVSQLALPPLVALNVGPLGG